MKFIIRWGINAVALWAAIAILPGLVMEGNWTGILILALIFGLVNALLRPLIKLLTVNVSLRLKIRTPELAMGPVPSVPEAPPVPTWSVPAPMVVVPL